MTLGRSVAWVAVLVCLVSGPAQSLIWHGPDAPSWIRSLAEVVGSVPSAMAGREQPGSSYFWVGRWLWLAYLGLAVSLLAIPPQGPRPLRRLLAAALGVASVGDVLAYGLAQRLGPEVRHLGFWSLEVPAWAALYGLGSLLGVTRLRREGLHSRSGWALALLVPAGLGSAIALRYLPHALVLPFALAVAVHAQTTPRAEAPTLGQVVRNTLLGATAVAGLALALALPYRPVPIHGPEVDPTPLAAPPPTEGLRLHVFDTGANRMSGLLVADPTWRPVPAFVVEHPTHGLLAFDLGLPAEVAAHGEAGLPWPLPWILSSRAEAGQTLDAQLEAAGFAPAQVHTVVISHHHADHQGALRAFPDAEVIVGPGSPVPEHSQGQTVRSARSDRQVGPLGDAEDVFGDGSVLLIRGGGHTPEDLMALVALPEGPVLLAGDAVVHWPWLEGDDVERIATDPERAAEIRSLARRAVASGWLLIPGHDLSRVPQDRRDLVLASSSARTLSGGEPGQEQVEADVGGPSGEVGLQAL